MGKPLITQKRGKGSTTYRAHSFRYKGKSTYRNYDKETISGTIINLVHCQGHSAPLAEIKYADGETCLMVAPEGIRVGDEISAGIEASPSKGNSLTLERIPEGSLICNVERVPGIVPGASNS
ncbi:50S ribosomal protein L2, partial [Nanoarchaeota archaeon]